ncbi:MAG: sulfatase [Phycisphaerales bacterium]|nr:sulfatase [Phycisphaerales bacterium]
MFPRSRLMGLLAAVLILPGGCERQPTQLPGTGLTLPQAQRRVLGLAADQWESATREAAHSASADPPARRNVVIITLDSLRADHLHCMGYERETSPTMDRLAAEGVLFAGAVSTTSWTLPSHAALFTALPNSVHGCDHYTRMLGPERLTLAEHMAAQGYQTAGFYSGPFLHPIFGVAQGFESYTNCGSESSYSDFDIGSKRDPMHLHLPSKDGIVAAHQVAHADITSPRIVERVKEWLDHRDASRPFLMFVHMWDPHYEYIPPPPYDTRFGETYDGGADFTEFWRMPTPARKYSAKDVQHLRDLYDGEIAWTDAHIRMILDALATHAALDDTIIVVTADHGEQFLEHGHLGHHYSLFDEETRVPMIVWGPGVVPVASPGAQVTLMDVAPTVLDLLGLPPMPNVFGRSLRWLWEDGSKGVDDERATVLVLHAGKLDANGKPEWTTWAVRTSRWKRILTVPKGLNALFDLRSDPGEKRNVPTSDRKLAAEADGVFAAMMRTLEALRMAHPGGANSGGDLPPELINQLRANGYIGGSEDK